MDGLLRGGGKGGGRPEWLGHLCEDVVEGCGWWGVGKVESFMRGFFEHEMVRVRPGCVYV